MDSRLRVEVIDKMSNPQTSIYAALRQDYSEDFIFSVMKDFPSEEKCGELAVKHLLQGERGHYGCIEHVQIIFNVGWFPHSVMQQARTHRVGCSFDVQSMRYTGNRIVKAAERELDIEEVFYLRPLGIYRDRNGKKYEYTEEERAKDLDHCYNSSVRYKELIDLGYAEEHARGILPFDYRQHFVLSFNARSVLHFMDLRAKADAQEEIRWMCELIWPYVKEWIPAIADYYEKKRLHKALLAP